MERFPMPPCARTLGWKLIDYDEQRGWVRIEFDARPEFTNPAGFIQGGFLAAMLDDAMGPAGLIYSGGKRFTSTIDMHVSYLAGARPGKLIAEAQVVHFGKTIGHLEGRLLDPAGTLIARATASVRLVAVDALGAGPKA